MNDRVLEISFDGQECRARWDGSRQLTTEDPSIVIELVVYHRLKGYEVRYV